MDPAALTYPEPSCAACSPSSPVLSHRSHVGGVVLVQEITIPGDFTVSLPRSKGDGAKPLSFACVLNSRVNLAVSRKDAAACCPLSLQCEPQALWHRRRGWHVPWDVPWSWGMAWLPLGTQKALCSHAASWSRVLPPVLHRSALHSQREDDLLP